MIFIFLNLKYFCASNEKLTRPFRYTKIKFILDVFQCSQWARNKYFSSREIKMNSKNPITINVKRKALIIFWVRMKAGQKSASSEQRFREKWCVLAQLGRRRFFSPQRTERAARSNCSLATERNYCAAPLLNGLLMLESKVSSFFQCLQKVCWTVNYCFISHRTRRYPGQHTQSAAAGLNGAVMRWTGRQPRVLHLNH